MSSIRSVADRWRLLDACVAEPRSLRAMEWRKRAAIFARTLCLLCLVLSPLACGNKDEATTPDTNSPPVPDSLALDSGIAITNTSPAAVEARGLVTTQLTNAIRDDLAIANTLFGVYRQVPWADPTDGCWTFILEFGDVETIHEACLKGAGYEWTVRFNGTGLGGPTYDNWVSSRSTVSADGASGRVVQYATNITTESFSLAFRRFEDARAGAWTIVDGTVGTADSLHIPVFSVRPDSLLFWKASPRHQRAEIRSTSDRTSGRMIQSEWNETAAVWYRHYAIEWFANNSGTLDEYNQEGQIIRHLPWP